MMDETPALLLTRPLRAARRFAHDLRRAGIMWRVHFAPVLEIVPSAGAVPRTGTLLFTSENGVRAAGDLRGRVALAVGDRTAVVARQAGADCLSADGDIENLVDLAKKHDDLAPFWHVRGHHVVGDLSARLNAAGLETRDHVAYDQVEMPLTDAAHHILQSGRATILPLFSPRSARLVRQQLQIPVHDALRVVAISPAVGEAWGGPVRIAGLPNAEAMRDELMQLHAAGLVGPKGER